jgi:hypothetical protein
VKSRPALQLIFLALLLGTRVGVFTDAQTTTCAKVSRQDNRDAIDITHNPGGLKVSALINGRRAHTCADHQEITGRNTMTVENLLQNGSACPPDEIAVFAPDRRMLFEERPACFTDDTDLISFDLRAETVLLPDTVWLVGDNPTIHATLETRARDDIEWTNDVYSQSSCGLGLAIPVIKYGTLNGAITFDSLKQQVGFDTGRVNIYYVTGNIDAQGLEWADGQILIANDAGRQTLAHEFGHTLSLEHVDDVFNVMAVNSNTRRELTLGQCYRANLNQRSLPQQLAILTAPRVPRVCGNDRSPSCPDVRCPGCKDRSLADAMSDLGIPSRFAALLDAGGASAADPVVTSQLWQSALEAGAPDEIARVQYDQARAAYYRIKTYEISHSHPEWHTPMTETEYVADDFKRSTSSLQVSAILALRRLHGQQVAPILDAVRVRALNRGGGLSPAAALAIEAIKKH